MIRFVQQGDFGGQVQISASKSDSQRAILAAGLSTSQTLLIGVGQSADEQQMVHNIQQLGATVQVDERGTMEVVGIPTFPKEIVLNGGESGLGTRLITAVCAAHEGVFTIEGMGSLLQRPQTFFEEHLPSMGVRIESNNGKLPLTIHGPMHGGEMDVDGSMSSQFLSGLLMALPLLNDDSVIHIHDLKSTPYAAMTVSTLDAFGIRLTNDAFQTIHIEGGQEYRCRKGEYRIDRDWSSASYWLVAAALGYPIQVAGLNLKSGQADTAILEAFRSAHCHVLVDDQGVISIRGEHRTAFQFDATDCPDVFPSLVAFSAFCNGITEISGVHRLKNKESDRGAVLQKEFGKLGLNIELEEDIMRIHGGGKLHSAQVDANNDHRIAMSLAIAGMLLPNGVYIYGAESVAKSYPSFWEDLDALRKS